MDVGLPSHMPSSHTSIMSQSDSSTDVWDWLCVLRLEQYSETFHSAGLTMLWQCRNLTLDQLERMGVTLPGHQRRILASLNKTHGIRDTQSDLHSPSLPSESNQPLQEKGHIKMLQRERSVTVPEDEKCIHKQMEKGHQETLRPTPREREKPVPKERQASRKKEENGGGGKKKPVPEKRLSAARPSKEEWSDEGIDEERERPLPKERTKFRPNASVNSSLCPLLSPIYEMSLPPVPPRSSANCPPQRFSSALSPSPSAQNPGSPKLDGHDIKAQAVQSKSQSLTSTITLSHTTVQTQPQTLDIQPSAQHLVSDEGRKTSPVSSIISLSDDNNAPPLPPKVGGGPKGPPPIPYRFPSQSSRTCSSFPTTTATDEMQKDQTPQVPPRIRSPQTPHSQENLLQSAQSDTQPALPVRRVSQPPHLGSLNDKSDEYEEPEFINPIVKRRSAPERDMSLQVPSQARGQHNSWLSDEELLDDDDLTPWQERSLNNLQGSVCLPNADKLVSAVKENSSQLAAVIKMGWLEKNPPQGAIYYQRRWVKLDVEYLRYFDSDKDVYSKRIISTAFITNVTSVGELKFEVATNNRTFIFRAESEAERNAWVTVLQECTRGHYRRSNIGPGSPLAPDHQGYLELKGLRSKLYTVVAADKVFLYKNIDDYRIGVGITAIEMNVGNIKDSDRRNFDLTTPYRIFSFIAESEQQREQWVDAMLNAIGEALSSSEVAERIWEEPSNSFCADCQAPKPEWAAINLCVVVCKQCAGEHRGLGPSVSKVRSLKMDRKVWTEELIQVFLLLGNERVNSFWAANVPPSEALTPSSCSDERRRFITNKYRQGKYRKYHPLYGNQRELDNALCINVQCSDLLETISLIFCGADVNCSTGMTNWPSPISLANAHSQPLQAELIRNNLNTDLPQSDVVRVMEAKHYSPIPCVSHNGFLFKTASMARAVTERKSREEFSRRWCTLNDGTFSYYESDKNSNPNGTLKASEIVCLAVDMPEKHGYDNTFELYSESERLYLFGSDNSDIQKEWVKSIAKSFIPATAEPLLRMGFERIGRLKYKDGLNLQTSKIGWFALVGSTLHALLEGDQWEEIHLRKLNELSTQQDNEVLVLVEKGRALYIEGERKLDFSGWCAAIRRAAGSGGDTLSQQQLTETDIPVIVHTCIGYITQCGLTSEGIYRKSGVNSRVAALCQRFRHDARSVHLREGDHQVDDVSNTLKRFFRELEEELFTSENASSWLSTATIQDESMKISQYQQLFNKLPRANKATLQALINHLYCVQRFSDQNQMNLHNLAIVFGPTLFQTDGKDYTAGRTIEDLIQHYTLIFEVEEQQLKKQLEEITAINTMRQKLNTKFPSTEPGGNFICTVYVEEKTDTAELHVKIPGSMTAAELTCEVLDKRNISIKDKEYWSCWEVSNKEEMERLLHYQERVLPILHAFGTDSHLLIKKHLAMESMIIYLSSKVDPSKHGMMKFREERSILGLGLTSGSFNDRYFILNSSSLRMYKEVRSNRPERHWQVKNLKVYLGIKKRLRPPTCWGLTVVCESKKQERQQWYLCCDTQSEMREWYATFLSVQYDGDVWPQDGLQQTRMSRMLPDTRHGNVSLIPLRGSENEMRNSVAAFTQDPLALFRDVR